jgi:IclR family transcriptional regulator, KDG regulon repressor
MATQILTSVCKALKMLDVFSVEKPELTVAEVSDLLHMHRSSAFRVLSTLAAVGFIEKDCRTGRYRLGLRLLELAGRVTGGYRLRELAGPLMEELAQELGEIVHLSILDGAEIVYMDKRGQGQVLTVATRIGGRCPAHSSAMGKVLLAALSAGELKEALGRGPIKRMTANTITRRGNLVSELDRVRGRGYALDNEEGFLGIRCVAAPVVGPEGRVLAAVSVTAPKQRMDARRIREIRERLLPVVSAISARIRAGALVVGRKLEA